MWSELMVMILWQFSMQLQRQERLHSLKTDQLWLKPWHTGWSCISLILYHLYNLDRVITLLPMIHLDTDPLMKSICGRIQIILFLDSGLKISLFLIGIIFYIRQYLLGKNWWTLEQDAEFKKSAKKEVLQGNFQGIFWS